MHITEYEYCIFFKNASIPCRIVETVNPFHHFMTFVLQKRHVDIAMIAYLLFIYPLQIVTL